MTKVLLIEDDKSIISNLSVFLKSENFLVDCAENQTDAERKIFKNNYDLVLLDITLPDGNGFSLCSAIKSKSKTPVIFLSAYADEYSVVTGLDLGADDYISKPFRPRELISRIKSVLRRTSLETNILKYEFITVDSVKGSVFKNQNELFLSALEYRLLLVFLNNIGNILPRNKLLMEIWDIAGEFVNDNTLTVYIKRLREKIEEDPQNPNIIKTIRGIGYKVGD